MFDDEDEDLGTVLLMLIHPDPLKDDQMIVCNATRAGRVLMLQVAETGQPIAALCQAPEDPGGLKN